MSLPFQTLFVKGLTLASLLAVLAVSLRLILLDGYKSKRLLHNVLPHAIASKLKEHIGVMTASYGDVNILSADIVNFTSMSTKTSPENLVRLFNEVFSFFDRPSFTSEGHHDRELDASPSSSAIMSRLFTKEINRISDGKTFPNESPKNRSILRIFSSVIFLKNTCKDLKVLILKNKYDQFNAGMGDRRSNLERQRKT